jgi:class 3 adenylate cyclase
MALGQASEIVVSSVTRGLLEGSEFQFVDRGRHTVKGLQQPIEISVLLT